MEDGSLRRRLLIVSASLGAGHQYVGAELERRLSQRGHEVRVANFNDLMLGPTGDWLARLYPWLVNRTPRLYDAVYRTFLRSPQRAGERLSVPTLLALPRLRRLAARFEPDVVASTFHLAALAVARLRSQGCLQCPAVSVITTFAVYGGWLHPATDVHLCISPEAARDAARRVPGPAVACGPVVRPEFARPYSARESVRRDLGIPPDARVALVVAGSLGLGSVTQAVHVIGRVPGWCPVVLCGRNAQLRHRLERRGDAVALAWVPDMPAVMDAADVLVENAAGLSAKEALLRGLPVVTFRPIPGHGRDDAEACARLGLTDVLDDEGSLITALHRLVDDSGERRARIARGRQLFETDAAAEIEQVAAGRTLPAAV